MDLFLQLIHLLLKNKGDHTDDVDFQACMEEDWGHWLKRHPHFFLFPVSLILFQRTGGGKSLFAHFFLATNKDIKSNSRLLHNIVADWGYKLLCLLLNLLIRFGNTTEFNECYILELLIFLFSCYGLFFLKKYIIFPVLFIVAFPLAAVSIPLVDIGRVKG